MCRPITIQMSKKMNDWSVYGLGLSDMFAVSQGKTFNQEPKSITLQQWQRTRSSGRSLLCYKASVFTTVSVLEAPHLGQRHLYQNYKNYNNSLLLCCYCMIWSYCSVTNIFIIRMDRMTALMWRGLLLVVRIIAQICNFSCTDCFRNFQQVDTLFSLVSVSLSVRLIVCRLDYT